MGSKYRVLIVIAVAAILGGFAWLNRPPPDPIYKGKALSVWLQVYSDHDHGTSLSTPLDYYSGADEALKHIGTNAIPLLLSRLRVNDSGLKLKAIELATKFRVMKPRARTAHGFNEEGAGGFFTLGATASNAVPALIEIYRENISPYSQCLTVCSLAWIGPSASNAVPVFLDGTRAADESVRMYSARALVEVHAQPEIAVPVFTRLLQDTNSNQLAAYASYLGEYGTNARGAVPTLKSLLQNPDSDVRRYVADALEKIEVKSR